MEMTLNKGALIDDTIFHFQSSLSMIPPLLPLACVLFVKPVFLCHQLYNKWIEFL